jgi:2-methylcitrate dehydratase PrpD
LSIAASQAAGLQVQEGTTAHFLELGFPCRAGAEAAILVQRGTSAREDIIERPGGFCSVLVGEEDCDFDEMVKSLGDSFLVESPEIHVKKYPCCFANHMALDGFFALVEEQKISAEEIEGVEVSVNEYIARWLRHPEPKTADEAKFSLHHTLGSALLKGRVWVDCFFDEYIGSEEARRAREKVKIVLRKDWPAERAAMRVRLEVKLKDGRKYSSEINKVSKLSRDDQIKRYRELASKRLTQEEIEQSLGCMLNIEDKRKITELMKILIKKGHET